MNLKGKNILVAMSGGIDSTMTAILLKEEGANVIGVTMKLGDTKITFGHNLGSTCCTLDDINDARNAAVMYDFPHYVVDLKEVFEKEVIDNFVDKQAEGLTPNPCILCNKEVKWGTLLDYADQLGCEFIATGHYAKIKEKDGRYYLSRAKDKVKDQTYFLWALSQDQLKRTMFPLGDYTKDEVRDMAQDFGVQDLAQKSESTDICFVGDANYAEFLKLKSPERFSNLEGGDIIKDGIVIGTHKGFPFYTIGQRKGLGVSFSEPLYVTGIDAKRNEVYVGTKDELDMESAILGGVNLQKYEKLGPTNDVFVKVRSRGPGVEGNVFYNAGVYMVDFTMSPKGGIAPGQSAVFYDGDDVVGGGFIKKTI